MLLGIDIGTTKTAAVLTDEERRVCAVATRAHEAGRPSDTGRAEQDVGRHFETVRHLIRELPAESRARIRAIGVTGQMHGAMVLDSAGMALTPLVTWQDQRCLSEPQFLTSLNARTGHALRSGYGCATLCWLRAHGELPTNAVAATTIHDWLVMRLCGQTRPVTDPTDAASWGLFDLRTLNWDERAVVAAELPRGLLPEVKPCGSYAGGLTSTLATELGLPRAIPVAVALGDNQASLLATLREPERELALTLGTGGQLSAVLPAGAPISWELLAATHEYRPFPCGRFAVVAASLCGGAAWAWLPESLASWMKDLRLPCPSPDELFARIDGLGLTGQDVLRVRPSFLGERHAGTLRGSVEGIDLGNFTIGNLARALARGILINLKEMLPQSVLRDRTRVVGSGNALRRSRLLQALTQEVFGLPLVLTEGREEAAVGAALNAQQGEGSRPPK
jgi:sedoheptulokinase